jgi:DNA-binding response OmpR family regulator
MSAANFTLLVADDNEFVRTAISELLRAEGYEVVEASDGQQVLRGVDAWQIDLVLLDINMPGMDGLEALRSLREIFDPKALPVIMVTADTRSEKMVQAFDLGANDYVTKSVAFPLVLARVQAQLAARFPDRYFSADDDDEVTPFSKVRPGMTVDGRYRIEEPLDAGNHGAVYRATDMTLQRNVALKLLRVGGLADDDVKNRFAREGASACRLEHPNAVRIFDFNVTATGVPHLVMELLTGNSLGAEIEARGHLPVLRCAEVLRPICDVLDEAHASGVIHRDIKPVNVFLHRSHQGEVVKVLDFGIAKLLDDSGQSPTTDGVGPGTPAYMAPERFAEKPYDGSADIYSVGVMLYQMLTGDLPFYADNPILVAISHLNKRPPQLCEARPELPAAIGAIVAEALAKDPTERPGAKELGERFATAAGLVS